MFTPQTQGVFERFRGEHYMHSLFPVVITPEIVVVSG